MNKFMNKLTNLSKPIIQPPVYLSGEMNKECKSRGLSESIEYKMDRKKKANIARVFHSKRIEMTFNKRENK